MAVMRGEDPAEMSEEYAATTGAKTTNASVTAIQIRAGTQYRTIGIRFCRASFGNLKGRRDATWYRRIPKAAS